MAVLQYNVATHQAPAEGHQGETVTESSERNDNSWKWPLSAAVAKSQTGPTSGVRVGVEVGVAMRAASSLWPMTAVSYAH